MWSYSGDCSPQRRGAGDCPTSAGLAAGGSGPSRGQRHGGPGAELPALRGAGGGPAGLWGFLPPDLLAGAVLFLHHRVPSQKGGGQEVS